MSSTSLRGLLETGHAHRVDSSRVRDVALSASAMLFGLASLAYPLGHDQSIHFVVAREWLLHGSLPYRDFFDHKPPGIYVLYMAALSIFGPHEWAIRPIELATVVVLGWIVASLGTPRGVSTNGRYGPAALAVSFVYYGFFTFSGTAEPELWATTFALGALALARRGRSPAAVGVLCALALLVKPTIAPFVPMALGFSIARARSWKRTLAVLAAALTAPIALVAAWFAMRGALGAMIDVVVVGNVAYVRHGRSELGELVRLSFELFGWFHPLSLLLLIATTVRFVLARRRRDLESLRPWAMGIALVGGGYLSVVVQMRFHIYHYVVIVPGIALLLVRAIEDATRARPIRVAVAMAIVLALYPLAGRRARSWWNVTSAEVRFRFGDATREDVDSMFVTAGGRGYVYGESRDVSAWIASHSSPSDTIAVRGCHPEIYAMADRSPATRFFWTTAYTREMTRAAWADEDHRDIERTRPRFVVIASNATRPEAPSWFTSRGWTKAVTIGRFIVLARH